MVNVELTNPRSSYDIVAQDGENKINGKAVMNGSTVSSLSGQLLKGSDNVGYANYTNENGNVNCNISCQSQADYAAFSDLITGAVSQIESGSED